MNKNAHKLVKALRSGDYSQAQGQLRSGEGFCCLGVACDVYAKEHNAAKWEGNTFFAEPDERGVRGVGQRLVLPLVVADWLGFASVDGKVPSHSTYDHRPALALSEMNDRGTPFHAIAYMIEAEPHGLFKKDE